MKSTSKVRQITSVVDGAVIARSKNFPTFAAALRVAERINQQKGHLWEALPVQNRRTKREAWYLELTPQTEPLRRAFLAREITKRQLKAIEEGPAYQFTLLTDTGAACKSLSGETYFLCLNTASGAVSCGCEDWKKVCALGLECKHGLASRRRGVWSQK